MWPTTHSFGVNPRLASFLVLVASVLVFGYLSFKIPRLEREYAGMVAEYKSRTSWGSVGTSMFQAFVDGFTLGETGEEGIFTEARKWNRLESDFAKRHAELSREYESTLKLRRWSFGFTGISFALFIVLINLAEARTGPNSRDSDG